MKLQSVSKCGRFVRDYATFVRELPESFSEIGAMLPSSRYLAKAMVKPLANFDRSKSQGYRILEIGPGTGPFTRQIVRLMHTNDEFVVCEINNKFLLRLQSSLETMDVFPAKQHAIKFYCGSVLELPKDLTQTKFDFIVCSLPFHNFSPAQVEEFLIFFESILDTDGTFSFFHYAGLRRISGMSPNKDVRNRIKGVDSVIGDWCLHMRQGGLSIHKDVSMLNLPPAVAITLSRDIISQ